MQRVLLMTVCGLGLIVSGAAESRACGLFGCLFGHGCFSRACYPPPCPPPPCCPPQPCCPTTFYAPQPCCPTGCGYGPASCPTGTCQQTDPLAPATTVYGPAPARTVYEFAPLRFPRIVQRPFARPFFFAAPFGRVRAPEPVFYSEDTRETPPSRSQDERRPTTSSMHWEAMNVLR